MCGKFLRDRLETTDEEKTSSWNLFYNRTNLNFPGIIGTLCLASSVNQGQVEIFLLKSWRNRSEINSANMNNFLILIEMIIITIKWDMIHFILYYAI